MSIYFGTDNIFTSKPQNSNQSGFNEWDLIKYKPDGDNSGLLSSIGIDNTTEWSYSDVVSNVASLADLTATIDGNGIYSNLNYTITSTTISSGSGGFSNISSEGVELFLAMYSNKVFSPSDDTDPNKGYLLQNSRYYTNTLFDSINQLFYKDFYKNPLQKVGNTNIYQKRNLHEIASIISIPQNLYGDTLKPLSVQISFDDESFIGGPFFDDGYGNMIDKERWDQVYTILPPLEKYEIVHYDFDNLFQNTTEILDKSVFSNHATGVNLSYKDIADDIIRKKAVFTGNSYIHAKNKEYLNFEDDFSISFMLTTPSSSFSDSTILTKNGGYESVNTNRVIEDGLMVDQTTSQFNVLNTKYPFNIELTSSGSIEFSRYDGSNTPTVSSSTLTLDKNYHIICQKENDTLQLIIDGTLVDSTTDTTNVTKNICDLFIGVNGDFTNYFTGAIDRLKIYQKALTETEYSTLANAELNTNADFYIGNVFYELGIIVITTPLLDLSNLFNNWILIGGYWEDIDRIWIDTELWYDRFADVVFHKGLIAYLLNPGSKRI